MDNDKKSWLTPPRCIAMRISVLGSNSVATYAFPTLVVSLLASPYGTHALAGPSVCAAKQRAGDEELAEKLKAFIMHLRQRDPQFATQDAMDDALEKGLFSTAAKVRKPCLCLRPF